MPTPNKYASIDTLRTYELPTVDVEVNGVGLFRLRALSRQAIKDAVELAGGRTDEGVADAELLDLLLLAASLVDPDLDPRNEEHVSLLRGLPVPALGTLLVEMMKHSGLSGRSPFRV